MNQDSMGFEREPCRSGIWIDHRVAKIVRMEGENVRCTEIKSDVEKRHRSTGGLRMPGKNYIKSFVASEKNRDRAREEHIRRFYEDVVHEIGDAGSIILLGPGEAKVELAKKIRSDRDLADRLADVRVADAMTNRQLIATIRQWQPS